MPGQTIPAERPARRIALLLSIPLLAFLAYLTLWPTTVEDRLPALHERTLSFFEHALHWSWLGSAQLEVLANIAVFIPVGILALLVMPRRFRALAFLVGPLLSAAIEGWQAIALPERTASLADVAANSAGATLGACLTALILLLVPRPRTLEPA